MFKHFAGLVVSVALATGASASTIIFDNQSGHPGGSLTFGTTSGNASLVNGVIDQVTKLDGSVVSFAVSGTCGTGSFGCLNFTTGSFLNSSTVGDITTYRYDAGGSISIFGVADGGSGTLYSAAGFSAPVTLNYNASSGLSSLSGTLSAGTINAALASTLGINPVVSSGTDTNSEFNIVFQNGTGIGSATTNSVQLTATSATPEPSSLLLMGAGLIGLSRLRRRS